ncbi:unnamed protein product, partial [Calypogeia fissa]
VNETILRREAQLAMVFKTTHFVAKEEAKNLLNKQASIVHGI